MPRPIELRASYLNDVGYLTRLSQAVALDKVQTGSMAREIQTLINSLIEALNRANKNRMEVK
jgi:hypothetical protein